MAPRTREELLEHALQALLYLDPEDGPCTGAVSDTPLSMIVDDVDVVEAVRAALATEGG